MPSRRDAFWASKLVSMAAPSHAVPSWKTTLGRSVMVQEVWSGLGVTVSARYGSQAPWALMMVSGSNTVRAYMTPTSSNRAVVGLKPDSSASTPKTSEPPFLGVAADMPLRPGPLVDAAPAMPDRSSPSADAPTMPAAVAAPPASSVRRLNGILMDFPSLSILPYIPANSLWGVGR